MKQTEPDPNEQFDKLREEEEVVESPKPVPPVTPKKTPKRKVSIKLNLKISYNNIHSFFFRKNPNQLLVIPSKRPKTTLQPHNQIVSVNAYRLPWRTMMTATMNWIIHSQVTGQVPDAMLLLQVY